MKRTRPLPYGRQCIDDDDVIAVVAQLRSDWLTQGPTVAEFEKSLCEITGARFAVAVSNGTAALHLACLAADVGPGDVGLAPDVTFLATANAVRYAGGRPVLVDIEPSTGLVDLDRLEQQLDELVRAGTPPKVVLPVSFAGSPPDLASIRAMADRVGARVIEDAAHSLGATYTHRGITVRSASCTHTDMAILSFHPVKHLTTGEGGAVTTNDEKLFQRLCDLRTHGITKDRERLEAYDGPWYYEQQSLGFNYRITDVQCALGVSQARKLPKFLARRRAIAAQYDEAFAVMHERVVPLAVPAWSTSAYHLYVVRLASRTGETLESLAMRRKEAFLGLRECNIAPQVHYVPIHRQPDYRRAGLSGGEFPGADAYYASCISLPMFPSMTDEDVADVVHAIGSLIS